MRVIHRRTPPRWTAVVLALSAATVVGAENLVANPGFEKLAIDKPARWDMFVQPQPGATGKLVPEADSGGYAVMLHTPRPYPQEPLNNWSQNILRDDLGGKTLRAEVRIKVAEATEAALWVQCWRRQPWTLLHTANSSFDTPIYGTQDWQTVSMNFDAPADTDYLAVRCVLIGTGSAWFDDVAVHMNDARDEDAASGTEALVVATESTSNADNESVDALIVAVPRIETSEREREPATPVTKPEPPSVPAPAIPAPDAIAASEVLTESLDRARDEGDELATSIAELEAANRALLDELVEIREEILSLRGSPEPLPRTPPLVPHGVDWSEEINR